jgi:hypothetical protein
MVFFILPQKIGNWLMFSFLSGDTDSQPFNNFIIKEEKNGRRTASEISPYFSYNIRINLYIWGLSDDELDMALWLGLGTSAT